MISQKLIRQPADKGQVSHQRGFTLIEIMVVILIIGILSSVILAFLGDARDNARDSKIKSEMDSFRKHAELIFQNGTYPPEADLCDLNNQPLLLSIWNTVPESTSINCVAQPSDFPTKYSVQVRLYEKNDMDENLKYCIDSEGYAGPGNNNNGVDPTCNK